MRDQRIQEEDKEKEEEEEDEEDTRTICPKTLGCKKKRKEGPLCYGGRTHTFVPCHFRPGALVHKIFHPWTFRPRYFRLEIFFEGEVNVTFFSGFF